jgi:hypothetical protein
MKVKPNSWLTIKEIAQACGCPFESVETLARRSYWPRVSGSEGAKFAVEIDVVRAALSEKRFGRHGRAP